MDYPAQRDFVKELAVACRKAGLGLFIYYSVGIDWHHPYFLPNTMYDPARPHYKEVPESYRFRNVEAGGLVLRRRAVAGSLFA